MNQIGVFSCVALYVVELVILQIGIHRLMGSIQQHLFCYFAKLLSMRDFEIAGGSLPDQAKNLAAVALAAGGNPGKCCRSAVNCPSQATFLDPRSLARMTAGALVNPRSP